MTWRTNKWMRGPLRCFDNLRRQHCRRCGSDLPKRHLEMIPVDRRRGKGAQPVVGCSFCTCRPVMDANCVVKSGEFGLSGGDRIIVRTEASFRLQWIEQPGRDAYIHILVPSRVVRAVHIRRCRSEYSCISFPMSASLRSCPEFRSTSTMKSLDSGTERFRYRAAWPSRNRPKRLTMLQYS